MSHSQFSNSIIPGLGPRKQSLRRKFISHNFFGNQNPREVPEGQKGVRKGRNAYQGKYYGAGYHCISSETSFSKHCLPMASETTLFQDGQTRGRKREELIHYLLLS